MESMEQAIKKQDVETDVEAGLIEASWQETNTEFIKRLGVSENLQTLMESLAGFKESFAHDLDTIDCSDGRVLDGRKIGIAGSGMLLPEKERADFIALYKGKTKEVTAHADCGAAKLKFAELQATAPEKIPAGITTADEYGAYCAEALAKDLEANYKFLPREEMASRDHNERALVLDATGKFDSTNLPGLPPHFVCTGAGLGFSEEYMKSELKTLTGIALSDHGFGDRFSDHDPFFIIVAAPSYETLAEWEKAAREALSEFSSRVAVKGFVRPDDPELN